MSDTGWDLQRAYDEGYKDGKRDAAAAIEELEKERDYYKQQYENRQRLIKSALGEEWT